MSSVDNLWCNEFTFSYVIHCIENEGFEYCFIHMMTLHE